MVPPGPAGATAIRPDEHHAAPAPGCQPVLIRGPAGFPVMRSRRCTYPRLDSTQTTARPSSRVTASATARPQPRMGIPTSAPLTGS